MDKKISILPIKQFNNAACGAACLEMIYSYFGLQKRQEKIFEEIKNLSTECGGAPITTQSIVNDLSVSGFFSMWGKFDLSKQRLRNSFYSLLKNNCPIIACIQFDQDPSLGHFIIIVDIEDENIFYIDPWDGQKKEILIDDLINKWKETSLQVEGAVFILASRYDKLPSLKNVFMNYFSIPKVKSFSINKMIF